jgi:hypothetical protein
MALFSGTALAHTLEQDGIMQVNLHIEPDDRPVLGKQQNLDFIYQSTQPGFDARDCVCHVVIIQDTKTLLDKDISAPAKNFSRLDYEFKKAADYQIKLSGKAKNTGQFDPFNVSFGLEKHEDFWQKSSYTAPANPKRKIDPAMLITGIGLFLFAAYLGYGVLTASRRTKD